MFKSAILAVLVYAVISINLSILADTISGTQAVASIVMTTLAAITTVYFGDSK